MMDMFFRYIKSGDIKVRIMYSPNSQLNQFPHGQDELYTKLYYTFIKRAFSIFNSQQNISLKIFLDELPESLKVCKKFKNKLVSGFIKENANLENSITLYKKDILEIDSKKHVVLQCIDVLLGVIEFYLNHDKSTQVSIRAQAKLDLFNYILENYILNFYPNFDFSISTGYFNSFKAWKSPYKHLVFKQRK